MAAAGNTWLVSDRALSAAASHCSGPARVAGWEPAPASAEQSAPSILWWAQLEPIAPGPALLSLHRTGTCPAVPIPGATGSVF